MHIGESCEQQGWYGGSLVRTEGFGKLCAEGSRCWSPWGLRTEAMHKEDGRRLRMCSSCRVGQLCIMARTLSLLVRTEVMYTNEGSAHVQHLQDETVVAVQLGYTLVSFRLCAERGCTERMDLHMCSICRV